MKRIIKKINLGIKDEKEGIEYYKEFPKKELTEIEKKHILDAEKDEKEHLKFLDQDKKTVLGRLK
jgi:rubrerythrin